MNLKKGSPKMKALEFNRETAFFVMLILVSILYNCKTKPKSNPTLDAIWGEDGLSLVAAYCTKLQECAKPGLEKLSKDEKALVEMKLNSSNCVQNFKGTNAYKLAAQNSSVVIGKTKACFISVVSAPCEQVVNGVNGISSDCGWLHEVQTGKIQKF
ncbi:hypothetical protein CH373_01350 [Leptospira perolatii]|uniref:Uncharacterized protein n=1 Tax=Leptospira perolatii TaxID=2023191 RepID=A0A2M9ZRX1_9LEPT|nr:hypothetical protein [Leptospira perolatii]PJZ71188.1 hypothetical protein CH360_01350 [Leptospira perolatii]PJZ74721.1 hypothetical protein CH373_01350 [Leptospira perolatii]